MFKKTYPANKAKIPFYYKHFKVLIVLLILIILIPGYLFLIKAKRNSYYKNKASVAEFQASREQNLKKLLNYNKIILSYNNITPGDQVRINEMMPITINLADLYINVASLVEELGLELDGLDIQASKEQQQKVSANTEEAAPANKIKGELKTATINLNISGVSYAKLKTLLETLEVNIKLFDIQSFDYNPSEGSIKLTIQTYYIE